MRCVSGLNLSVLSFLAAACSSVAPHYHTLVPVRSDVKPVTAGTFRAVELESVRVPAQVDRFELLVRQNDGGIALSENELWIAPLSEELKSALSVEIDSRLASANAGDTSRKTSPLSVRLNVERFESAPSRYAFIEASWQLREAVAARTVLLACRTEALERVDHGYAALVRGHRRAVILIADQIAVAIRQLDGGQPASCPGPKA